MRQQSEMTGMWSNITDEDSDRADDSGMQPDEGMGDMMGDMMGGGGGEEQEEGADPNAARKDEEEHNPEGEDE